MSFNSKALAFCTLCMIAFVFVAFVKCDNQKDNKITNLLRYIKDKSAQTVGEIDDPELNEADLSYLSEQELLDEICSRMTFVFVCQKSVETMARNYPEKLSEIVQALRSKSKNEDARKLLRHKLIEFGIDKADEKGLDKAVNTVVDLMVMRSPYGMAANQAVNLVSKYIV